MIPKRAAPSHPADYRPISLLPTFVKLLEAIVASRLQAFVTLRQLLPPEQSAFQSRRSALEQLTLLAPRAGQSLNAGLSTTAVCLDFEKAFDCVWHAGLLRTLRELLPPGVMR